MARISSATDKTPIGAKDFRILKFCIVTAQMYIETLLVMSVVREMQLNFFLAGLIVVLFVMLLQRLTAPLWKKFDKQYFIIPELSAADEIEERNQRTVAVKGAMQ